MTLHFHLYHFFKKKAFGQNFYNSHPGGLKGEDIVSYIYIEWSPRVINTSHTSSSYTSTGHVSARWWVRKSSSRSPKISGRECGRTFVWKMEEKTHPHITSPSLVPRNDPACLSHEGSILWQLLQKFWRGRGLWGKNTWVKRPPPQKTLKRAPEPVLDDSDREFAWWKILLSLDTCSSIIIH